MATTHGYALRFVRSHYHGWAAFGRGQALPNVNAALASLADRIEAQDVNTGRRVTADQVFLAVQPTAADGQRLTGAYPGATLTDDGAESLEPGDIIAVNPSSSDTPSARDAIRVRVITEHDTPHRPGERVEILQVHVTTLGGAGAYIPLSAFDRLPDAIPDPDGAYPPLALYCRRPTAKKPTYDRVFTLDGEYIPRQGARRRLTAREQAAATTATMDTAGMGASTTATRPAAAPAAQRWARIVV